MDMKDFGYGHGLTVNFGEALTENAQAQEIFSAMTPEQKQRVVNRARQMTTMEELRGYIDSLAGCKEGHPPYQL